MKARDTVMSDNQLYDILGVIPRDDEDIYDVIKKQAEITLKAVTDELKKQIEGVRANAFSVSLSVFLSGTNSQVTFSLLNI
ncbi:hypothetical protein LCGC14_2260960 [marine sediment metagenome]|uniref:Uncharacterized protein n=1 Tax=marine sediment metagenome TaxID=412755 RepID=A0A0F9FUS1_9ZZZZ